MLTKEEVQEVVDVARVVLGLHTWPKEFATIVRLLADASASEVKAAVIRMGKNPPTTPPTWSQVLQVALSSRPREVHEPEVLPREANEPPPVFKAALPEGYVPREEVQAGLEAFRDKVGLKMTAAALGTPDGFIPGGVHENFQKTFKRMFEKMDSAGGGNEKHPRGKDRCACARCMGRVK